MSSTITPLRTYVTIDRSDWPSGTWDTEVDKVQWIDVETDLDCIAVRNRIGAWCGYVGVGPEHPLHGVGYSTCTEGCKESRWCAHTPEAMFDVHGGLTYSNVCQEGMPESEGICHVVLSGRPDPVWWFGFDAAHGGDLVPAMQAYGLYQDGEYRTLEYVQAECAKLAVQLKAVT